MEYDDGENFTNFDNEYTPEASMHRIFHEIIFVLFAIVGICANVAIIYAIVRFKRMRTTENMFIVNWAIADLCSLIVTPSAYRIISILDNISISSEFMCTLIHIGVTLQVTTLFFVILLLIGWILDASFQKASEKFRKYYKYIIGSIWIINLLMSGISTGQCLADQFSSFPPMLLFGSFVLLLLIIIVLQCTRAVRKCLKKPLEHPTLMLTLTTSFAGCWTLGVLIFMVVGYARLHPITSIIAECAIFGSSIVTLVLLYRYSTDFQACLLQALKRSNNKYEDSICSFDNPIVKNMNNMNNKDSIRISFHSPNEELLSNAY